jgi:hypothetical protein
VCDAVAVDENDGQQIFEGRGRKLTNQPGRSDMSERHAEWKVRAEECTHNASAALDAAMSAISDQAKEEFLRVAEEWTRLAGAIMDAFLL